MSGLWAELVAALAGRPGRAMLVLALVGLCSAAGVLAPAVLARFREQAPDPGPLYGRAFSAYCGVVLLVSGAAGIADWAVRFQGVSAGFLHSFYQWPGFPWRDLVRRVATAADVEAVNLVVGTLALLAGPVVLGLTRAFAGPQGPPSAGELRRWGHHGGQPEPWLRTLVGGLLLVLAALVIGLAAFQPMFQGTGSVMVPGQVWASALAGGVLLFGLLVSRGVTAEQEEPPPPPEPPEPRSDLSRRDWEMHLAGLGFELHRAAFIEGDVEVRPAPLPQDQDLPNRTGWSGNSTIASFRLPPVDGGGIWKHQAEFVRTVMAELQTPKERPVLLNCPFGSGRSTAAFECVARTWLDEGRRSLVVYPSQAVLERHVGLFRRATNAPTPWTPTTPRRSCSRRRTGWPWS